MSTAEPRPQELPGLGAAEARARLQRFGPNSLVARGRARWVKEIAGPFLDPMAIMLIAAAAIYFALGETRDAVVMLVALVPVMGVDVFLQARSRSALDQLAGRVAPRARVVRDNRQQMVDTSELVPGDVLVLGEGDIVHADGVVRSAANLAIDESSLTGESDPQLKQPLVYGPATPAPSEACFYAGSVVLGGQGRGEITATGRATRFGEIARLVGQVGQSATPLQRRVGGFVKKLAVVAALVAVLVILLGRFRGLAWGPALLGGVSIAMAATPEEFPLVFTLFLSVGAWRLTKRGVLVRRLAAVETLGSTTVICTDKTGTLTRGEFVLEQVLPFARATSRQLLETAVLACESPSVDPMERAIVTCAAAQRIDVRVLRSSWRLARDHDFDPVGKHMSHAWTSIADPSKTWIAVKGALEGVLAHADASAPERRELQAMHARLASQGFRVLTIARRVAPTASRATREEDERNLSIVGFLGFRDPMRPEVPEAVRRCRAAGIRIKVVTGDDPLTARAVAESAGIVHQDAVVVTGDELATVSSDDFGRRVAQADILSRISPAQKHAVVEVLRGAGEVVAMTGDGINDAPALRRADVGVSMGRRGTDVARAAADLVLLNDDFASMVSAAAAGRKTFLDIQRAFLYLIAFHIPVVGLAVIPAFLGLPLLLLPIHLVWLELIVHPVSALLFQGDPPPADLMRRPPRCPGAPLLPPRALLASVVSGSLLTAAVVVVYAARIRYGEDQARGLALATLIVGYEALVLFERAAFSERWSALLPRSIRFWAVWGAAGASLPILMYQSAGVRLMRVAPLTPGAWLLATSIGLGAIAWRAVELRRGSPSTRAI